MTAPQASSQPIRIPRFVMRLNDFALAHGLEVEIEAMTESFYNDGTHLFSTWMGSREQFKALGLLTPCQYVHLYREQSYVSVPGGVGGRTDLALLTGYMDALAEDIDAPDKCEVVWHLDFGPATYEIELRDQVEVVTYADEILYHGTDDDLVAAGIEKARLPKGRRGKSSSLAAIPEWKSRRQPDGTVVYRVDSANKIALRLAEERRNSGSLLGEYAAPATHTSRPYLRLVVDNTRPSRDPKNTLAQTDR